MNSNALRIFQNEVIDDIAKVISKITGNQFSSKHSSMLEFRLKKRCLELKIDGLENYYQYFKANQNSEVNYLISLLTTHHTFFFREFSHFQYLEDKALPELIPIVRKRNDKKIKVWSAACSKGHEVYSLAMFFDLTLKQYAPDLSYHILGSDIDSESIAFAYNGVYTRKEVKEIPLAYLGNHWARGTGEISEYVKAKASLRDNIQWTQLNLLTLPKSFAHKFDIIFCRNVFIYFNQNQIKQSSEDLIQHLEPHGYYFIGVSESLNGLSLPLVSQGPSIYRPITVLASEKATQKTPAIGEKTEKSDRRPMERSLKAVPPPTPAIVTKEILKVLCVDDSPSILMLLKKILTKEEGFDVVGTASNGLDASQKLKTLKPDIMTLDIHMPQQTGVEYLQKNFGSNHPPVVMVSSVSREESDLALKALHLGASDYVEKPALSNLQEITDEIRRKLRSAYRNSTVYHQKTSLQLDDSFRKTERLTQPQKYLRFIIAHLSDKQKLESLIKEFGNGQPPTFVLLDGAKDALNGLAQGFSFRNQAIAKWPEKALQADDIFIADGAQFRSFFPASLKSTPASIMIMGEGAPSLKPILENWKKVQILLEDLGPKHNKQSPFRDIQSDVVPVTSFAYMSIEFLGRLK